MKCLIVLALPVCLFASCGGSDNEPASNASLVQEYEPDFSNPVGASDAFARAIEDQDLELIEQVLVPEEREEAMPMYRKNFESTKQAKGDWRIEFEDGYFIDENHTVSGLIYIQIENGKEKVLPKAWFVLKKIDDGTWRYSPAESRNYTEEIEALPDNPPGNMPSANGD